MQFNTAMLGLKYELINHLTESGLGWFSDYTDVDCCLTESTLSFRLLRHHAIFKRPVQQFCRRNKMQIGCFDRDTGRMTLMYPKTKDAR